jgi:hypothetical protein
VAGPGGELFAKAEQVLARVFVRLAVWSGEAERPGERGEKEGDSFDPNGLKEGATADPNGKE